MPLTDYICDTPGDLECGICRAPAYDFGTGPICPNGHVDDKIRPVKYDTFSRTKLVAYQNLPVATLHRYALPVGRRSSWKYQQLYLVEGHNGLYRQVKDEWLHSKKAKPYEDQIVVACFPRSLRRVFLMRWRFDWDALYEEYDEGKDDDD